MLANRADCEKTERRSLIWIKLSEACLFELSHLGYALRPSSGGGPFRGNQRDWFPGSGDKSAPQVAIIQFYV